MFNLMSNYKRLFQQALLAVSLAIGSAAAVAGPTYQVTVDTSSQAGTTGLLDFWFMSGFAGAAGATATFSDFSGAFGAEYDRFGAVSGAIPGTVAISNTDGENYLTQVVALGGKFGFAVTFDGAFETMEDFTPSLLSIGLFNADMSELLGLVAEFTVVPSADGMPGSVSVVAGDIGNVSEVPEPSDLLLILTAIAMAGIARRRQVR